MAERAGSIVHTEGHVLSAGGMALYYQSWRPTDAPRGAVAIVHGFGEHSGRYGNLVEALVPRGHALYAVDLRGHGRSPGIRGHVSRWDEYLADASALLALVRAQQPRVPLFLFGHSLGGLIVLDYGERLGGGKGGLARPDALIACGAFVLPGNVMPPQQVLLAKTMSRIWPTFHAPVGLETAALSRDPAVVEAYEADPLVHGQATARLGTEIMAAQERVLAHAGDLSLPVLMIHGEADRLCQVEGTCRVYEGAGAADKTLITYPECYHELHNDLDQVQVLDDVAAWIEARIP